LSLANAADENPSMPRRKILLSTGGNNYRPPLERSKSAPKLFAIEEMVDEEDEEGEECDDAEVKAKKHDDKKKRDEVKPCCKEDYLYPSITLGRRRCRRGHSIRKSRLLRGTVFTQKSHPPASCSSASIENDCNEEKIEEMCKSLDSELNVSSIPILEVSRKSLGSDEDFESFLLYNNYDSKEPLAGDLMSYFDLQLQTPTSSLITTTATMSMSDLLDDEMSLKNQRNSMSMSDLIDYQSDNELEDGDTESHGDIYFNQDSLLDTLRRQSKSANDENVQHQPFILNANNPADDYEVTPVECRNEFIFKRNFDDDLTSESPSSLCMSEKTICVNLDSDEGSISSGCETSSTMTAMTESQLPRRGSVLDRVRSFEKMADSQVTAEPIGERGSSGKFFPRSVTFPNGASSGSFIIASNESSLTKNGTLTRGDNGNVVKNGHDDDSDELSDESGYVEFQDLSLKSVFA
jgi:Phosphotyrosine interaction domain (PTB/PID)